MTIKVTATEAKAKFLSLLDDVAAGEEVEITRRGRTIARLIRAKGPHALRDSMKGVVIINANDEELYGTGERWNVERRRPR